MIGKGHWFQRRKYGGWGMFPKTWQGWVYLAVVIAIFVLIQYLPIDDNARLISLIIYAVIFAIDMVDIMMHIPKDEREKAHEALAERNALWAMIATLAAGVGYQAATSVMNNTMEVDPVILIALVVATLAKAATNIYLDRKN